MAGNLGATEVLVCGDDRQEECKNGKVMEMYRLKGRKAKDRAENR